MPGAGRLSCCEDWIINNNSQGNSFTIPTTIEEVTEQVKFNLGGGEDEEIPRPEPKEVVDGKAERVTERFVVKRVNSASVVEIKVGFVKRGSCNQSWRSRSVSVSSSTGGRTVRPAQSRVRLISALERNGSRYNSHHSSSEEEWFEEVSHKEHASPPASPNFSPKRPFRASPLRTHKNDVVTADDAISTRIPLEKKSRLPKDEIASGTKVDTTKCCSIM